MNRVFALVLTVGVVFGATGEAGPDLGLGELMHRQSFEAHRSSSSNPDINENGDLRTIEPGATLVVMDEDGPGIVTHFWNTVATDDVFYARSVVLRMYYDGKDTPSVVAPLGDFFGVGHAADRDLDSIPVSVTSRGRSRVCYWKMPFKEHIRITVSNDSPKERINAFYYQINWEKVDALPDDVTYFHAQYRQEFPAKPGNYVLLDTTGSGHYVGTVYSTLQMEMGWFGEGDDFFYIDGAELPQLRGTGTEDYFNDAWGYREFMRPYYGVPIYDGIFAGDRVSSYRWHILDPVPFEKSLQVEIEHRGNVMNEKAPFMSMELGGFFNRQDWVSSVAYWYQTPVRGVEDALPPPEQRLPPYRIIPGYQLVPHPEPAGLVAPVGQVLAYFPDTPDARIGLDFTVEEAGRYRIDGLLVESYFGGVYQPYLDGTPIGTPMDFTTEAKYDVKWVRLDTHDLEAGVHTLRFEGVDQVPAKMRAIGPKHYTFAIGALTLLRLDTMEGYHAALDEALAGESR